MDNHSNLFIGSAIKNIRNRKRLNGKKYTQTTLVRSYQMQSQVGMLLSRMVNLLK